MDGIDYAWKAKTYIKEAMLNKDVKFPELSLRLKKLGYDYQSNILANKINKGSFDFSFALEVLAVLGYSEYHLAKIDKQENR